MAIVAVCRLAILKRMPTTPDSVCGTSGAGNSQSVSPEKSKDEDLGWFPNPKGEYTKFSNSILPKFYVSFWTTCPYKERFRRCFATERKRQWQVRELSLYFSHHKIPLKGKKAEKVAMIKAHIGSLMYDSMGRQHPRKSPLRNVQQQVTSSLSEVETDSQSDVVDRVVGSSPSSSLTNRHRRLI